MVKKIEQAIQKDILRYLKTAPGYFWRNQSTGLYDPTKRVFRKSHQVKGTSDILGILKGGRFVAIEVKAPGGKLSNEQKEFLHTIRANGGLAIVAYDAMQVHNQIQLALDGVA